MPTFYNIVNLHAVALPMFDWHTSEVMYLSWTFFALVGRFIYLVCLLMELAT
jgi:hypothetical protein